MIIRVAREKGFIDHESSIEGLSVLQYRGELFDDNGLKFATTLGHSLPSVMRRIEKELIKLDEKERGITSR